MAPLLKPLVSRTYEKPSRPVSSKSTKLLPITNILLMEEEPTQPVLSKEKLLFCYRATIKALNAYLQGDFAQFDPLTTTNCCHGISLLVRKLIIESSPLNIKEVLKRLENQLYLFDSCLDHETSMRFFQIFLLPCPIIKLTQIYILSSIKEEDLERGGWRSIFHKLNEISPISKKLCNRTSKSLQTYFSNEVAVNYREYLEGINGENLINGIPIREWGKYIQSTYIRMDKRGRKYAPCLFFMQVSLAYLIQNRAKIAVVNDLKCSKGVFKSRFIQLLVGDGHSNFTPTDSTDLRDHEIDKYEPIIIFSGCVYSDHLDHDCLKFRMLSWLDRFPSLVLACDVLYPQYPNVGDDPDFNNKAIIPDNEDLKSTIRSHREVSGVSAWDSSLFCLSHIYTASFQQVFHTIHKRDSLFLPHGFIPNNKLQPPKLEQEQAIAIK